jgi:hypothetical protein
MLNMCVNRSITALAPAARTLEGLTRVACLPAIIVCSQFCLSRCIRLLRVKNDFPLRLPIVGFDSMLNLRHAMSNDSLENNITGTHRLLPRHDTMATSGVQTRYTFNDRVYCVEFGRCRSHRIEAARFHENACS